MRILGIDLGTASIKAVEMDSAFGRYEIHDYHEIKRAPGTPPGEVITQFIAGLSKKPDKIAVAMKTGNLTFRNITLPTRDKKAILAGVGFELEDELPFQMENSVYEYCILSQTKQSTFLHVAATLKKHVGAALAGWLDAGIDPDMITTEAWAYRALMNRVLDEQVQQKPVLLVHIGHERTTMYLHWQGSPILSRELAWGGRDLTTAICQKYQIPIDQAEAAKLDHGFVVPESQRADATPEQLEFSETLNTPLRALASALKQTELSCKNLTHHQVSQIYIAGGAALLPGLARVLEENLHTPVRPLQALSTIATSGVAYSEHTDAVFGLAVALALCQVGSDRQSTINFRKGEFAKQGQTRDINIASLRKPLMALGAILVCFLISTTVQTRVYKARLAETDAQLEKSIRSFFGAVSTSAVQNYMTRTSTLRTSVDKELTKQRDTNKLLGPNPHSPVDFLRELSIAIPKDVVVDMTEYQVGAAPAAAYSLTDETTASLSFLVSSPQMAEKLNNLLSSKLNGLQKGKMEESKAEDGSQKWKVTFTGKPTEDSYGK